MNVEMRAPLRFDVQLAIKGKRYSIHRYHHHRLKIRIHLFP